jgi:hypothetical protein
VPRSTHSDYMVLAKCSTGSVFTLYPDDIRERSIADRVIRCKAKRHAVRGLKDVFATCLGTFAVTGQLLA